MKLSIQRSGLRVLIAMILETMPLGSAVAEETVPTFAGPAVVVSFEGGLVGDNMADVLSAVSAAAAELPTETHVVRQDETLCGLLHARRLPPPCSKLGAFVDRLNPSTRPFRNGLRVGQAVVLPALSVEPYMAANSYSAMVPEQFQKAQQLQRNPSWLAPHTSQVTPDLLVVEYKAYRLTIPVADDEIALELAERLGMLESANVFVDVQRAEPSAPAKLNAAPSLEDIRSRCDANGLVGSVYRYADLSDADLDALPLVEAASSPEAKTVNVYLIDIPLVSSPNLTAATTPVPDWTCRWSSDFQSGLHHSTHLAGIIASRTPVYGFAGLAPNARLRSFVWQKLDQQSMQLVAELDAERQKLADVIRANATKSPSSVYLAATSFDLPRGVTKGHDLPDGKLRFSGRVARAIQLTQPLLIVAAGQVDNGNPPEKISRVSPLSPQYFGDLPNVVVVTACSDCTRNNAGLMQEANYSDEGRAFVHVAAPGGVQVPGWISAQEIGAARGTSQASAYVAGIAASMIGRFPDVYGTASTVKMRLQVTSRPLPIDPGPVERPDQLKLAAGIVDPVLSLLDPNKNWVKDATGWRDVQLKLWPDTRLPFSNDNGRYWTLKGENILRLLRMPVQDTDGYWSIYTDLYQMGEDVPGAVGRVGPVRLEDDVALVLCDGTTIKLSTVQDFIPSLASDPENACT